MFQQHRLVRIVSTIAIAALLNACSGNGNGSHPMAGNRVIPFSAAQVYASVPVATLSPTSLSFAVYVNSWRGASKYVTLTNTGTAALGISSIAVTGPGYSQWNNCTATLAASAKCTITVTFRTLAARTSYGTLSVTDNASGSPQKVSLTGTGLCSHLGMPCAPLFPPCCAGLRCIPFSVRAYCEPSSSVSLYSGLHNTMSHISSLWAAHHSNQDAVSVVDLQKGALIKNIVVHPGTASIAITPDAKKLYVANTITRSVSIIDAQRNVIVKTITLGTGPADVAMSPNGLEAYVANDRDQTIAVVDTASDTLVGATPESTLPTSIISVPRCNHKMVGSLDGSIVYFINTKDNANSRVSLAALKLAAF